MFPFDNFDAIKSFLIGIAPFVVIGIIAVYILAFIFKLLFVALSFDFTREWRRLKLEISRTYGKDKEHYKKKRRQLLLSLLPFFRY